MSAECIPNSYANTVMPITFVLFSVRTFMLSGGLGGLDRIHFG